MDLGRVLRDWWPMIVVVGGGLIAFGALSSNVGSLQTQQDKLTADVEKQRTMHASDHDILVRLDAQQQQTNLALGEIKSDVKEVSRLLRRSTWDRITGRDSATGQDPPVRDHR